MKEPTLRLLLTFALLWLSATFARAEGMLVALNMDATGTETVLSLDFSGRTPEPTPRFVDKRRIILDFEDMAERLDGTPGAAGQEIIPGEGIVRQVRYARRNGDDLRVVLDLASDATVSGSKMDGKRYTMSVTGIGEASGGTTPFPRLKPAPRLRAKPVIVVDAGHGGRDPGAIGVAGTREKDITFSAAKMLAKRLRDTGRYEVVMTRGKDVYIAHEERLRIARLKGADLFISIHADSAGSFSAKGASVYTLSARAVTRSRRLVRSQNWIMDVDLGEQTDAVGDILVDLAQRKTFSQSDEFADILIAEVGKSTSLVRNSHRRAGYFVLLAPDVPAVLLEMGFLSNPTDEKNLGSAKHRDRIMAATVKAIDKYFGD